MANLFSLEYFEYPQHIYKHVIRVVPNDFGLPEEEFEQFISAPLKVLMGSFEIWCIQRLGEKVYEGRWQYIKTLRSFYFKDQNDAFEFKMRFG